MRVPQWIMVLSDPVLAAETGVVVMIAAAMNAWIGRMWCFLILFEEVTTELGWAYRAHKLRVVELGGSETGG